MAISELVFIIFAGNLISVYVSGSSYNRRYHMSPSNHYTLRFGGGQSFYDADLLSAVALKGNFGSYYASPTTWRHVTQPPTTATSTTSKPKLVDALSWLASKLNPNGTLTIGQNAYELGEISTPIIEKECPHTPLNATQPGKCSTLSLCPDVHSYLTDFSVYQQYFCAIETTDKKYAGVCCPTKTRRN